MKQRTGARSDSSRRTLIIAASLFILVMIGLELLFILNAQQIHEAPFFVRLLLIFSMVTATAAFIAVCMLAVESARRRRLSEDRHEVLNHFTVLLAHLTVGKVDRALAYLRKMVFCDTYEARLDEKVDEDIMSLIAGRVHRMVGQGVHVELDIGVPPRALVESDLDPTVVVGNLLNNAFDAAKKARPPERPKVILRMHEQAGWLHISVWNNGEHIPKEMLDRVFKRGFTTKKRESEDHCGIGLALCRDMVRRAGGDVRVTSSALHGTSFQVSVPLHRAAAVGESRIQPAGELRMGF